MCVFRGGIIDLVFELIGDISHFAYINRYNIYKLSITVRHVEMPTSARTRAI